MPPKTVKTPQEVKAELERPVNNLTKRQRGKIARKPGRNKDLTNGFKTVDRTLLDDPFIKSIERVVEILSEAERKEIRSGPSFY